MDKTKEKEPAPAPTETSSKLSTDNNNLTHHNDNIYRKACQAAFKYADQATKDILQIYGNMTDAEKKAFDLGIVYMSTLYARNNLEEAIMEEEIDERN